MRRTIITENKREKLPLIAPLFFDSKYGDFLED